MRAGDVLIPHDEPIQKIGKQPSPAWGRNEQGRLMLRCACGIPMGLAHHSIDADGVVTPSIHHDEPPKCDWHVMATLEDWKP